ncbi:MBL fold metallo-hydrolase [Streptomyces bauhiniae]|uniref:MBL fold metallo-hydrolase n=1 Tax=Streptomyces bauhiniae TaxID=2340725 RepID=UPI0036572745
MPSRFALAVLAGAGLAAGAVRSGFKPKPVPVPQLGPDAFPLPEADPPDDMDVIAVPTGVNHRNALYAYRGGSYFDRRDFYIGAALVKHPQGDLLLDIGFGRGIDQQFSTMPKLFQKMTKYSVWRPAVDQLAAAGYDMSRLGAILLTHAHWDHMSGLPDFPGVRVMVTRRDLESYLNPHMHGRFGPPFSETHFEWDPFDFDGGPYLGFPRSLDVYGDGSIVCVPSPGHTPGSIVIFVTTAAGLKYAFVGDLVWQREGLIRREERPLASQMWADFDANGTRTNIIKMAQVVAAIPELVVVPAHDQNAFADLGRLPHVKTDGITLQNPVDLAKLP